MKSTVASVVLALAGLAAVSASPAPAPGPFDAILAMRDCHSDNCYRYVDRKAATAQHYADCNSAFACSSTPAAVVVTATATVTGGTVTITQAQSVQPPASSPTAMSACNVPAAFPTDGYATACGNAGAWASACACNGVGGASTSVAAAPTVTATVTYTQPAVIVYV